MRAIKVPHWQSNNSSCVMRDSGWISLAEKAKRQSSLFVSTIQPLATAGISENDQCAPTARMRVPAASASRITCCNRPAVAFIPAKDGDFGVSLRTVRIFATGTLTFSWWLIQFAELRLSMNVSGIGLPPPFLQKAARSFWTQTTNCRCDWGGIVSGLAARRNLKRG